MISFFTKLSYYYQKSILLQTSIFIKDNRATEGILAVACFIKKISDFTYSQTLYDTPSVWELYFYKNPILFHFKIIF